MKEADPAFAYLVHDVTDAAVVRRVQMFIAGGADVTVLGFRRRGTARERIGKAPVIDLGTTGDGKLVRRIGSVLAVLLRPDKVRRALRAGDAIMARNLETLVIARVLGGRRRIVYECLDIHRLLVGQGMASRAMRGVERWAMRGTSLLVISSPRFLTEYFALHHAHLPEVLLVENRLLDVEGATAPCVQPGAPRTAPWVIGWFGMLRCARSLAMLEQIVGRANGRVRVLIAGIASPAVFPDFAARVGAMAGFDFVGSYTAADLRSLYGRVDFAWAIDYFEEGLNSTWLLPNRLYESLAYGAVPIALAGTETAAWLERHQVGMVVADPETDVVERLVPMDAEGFAAMARTVGDLPSTLTRAASRDCRELVEVVAGC